MKKNKIKKAVNYFGELLKYYLLFPISKIIYRKHQIYLISERGNDARDNGYHLFKYYREKYPEKEVYYIISKESKDYHKVSKYGNIVEFQSVLHYLLLISAEYKISTHIMGFTPNRSFYANHAKLFYMTGKQVFLQHGVTKDDLPQLYREKTNLDMFVCGAKPEYEFVNNTFHYNNGEVVYTGLARFDNLWDCDIKKQILIMPTWRMYLKYSSPENILSSKYVEAWNDILNDSRLMFKLEEKGIKLIFYPHYEMQPYIELFSSSSEMVIIADFNHYDVQELLKASEMLITDYSSVFFDFAYMNKPCLYYQFDQEDFLKGHYSKGYFDYETMGFGPVEKEKDKLVDRIVELLDSGFSQNEEYQSRVSGFFEKYDRNNCERIVEAIEHL